MQYSEYKITKFFRAPKVILADKEKMTFKEVKEDELIVGYMREPENGDAFDKPLMITKDGYAVPAQYVVVTKEVISDIEQYAKRFDKIANTTVLGEAKKMAQGSQKGMMLGTGVGLVYSIMAQKNLFTSIIVGAVIGGILGVVYEKHVNNNKKEVIKPIKK